MAGGGVSRGMRTAISNAREREMQSSPLEVMSLEHSGDRAFEKGDLFSAAQYYREALQEARKDNFYKIWQDKGDGIRDLENTPVEAVFRLESKLKRTLATDPSTVFNPSEEHG